MVKAAVGHLVSKEWVVRVATCRDKSQSLGHSYMCVFFSPNNFWMVSNDSFSVEEVSQQLGICRDLVEIGRWMEKKGCVSAWQEARLMMSSCCKSLQGKAISGSKDLVLIHELFVSLLLITELCLACFWSVLCPLPWLIHCLLKPAMFKASYQKNPFVLTKISQDSHQVSASFQSPKSRASGNAKNTD